ncbi:septum formation family protein [Salinibacterium sp. G-O1]|uniref:septum formation family protein n=1 Tax=Salinibacterium sp. G-O1 TaxID=3046208 RepID=UPI0024B972C9|nr:septum formation family protein [Salinibacterium sp. G-O1]MDJ0333765.1 septum formation family protein [Salinibacterium sp. G-O1]
MTDGSDEPGGFRWNLTPTSHKGTDPAPEPAATTPEAPAPTPEPEATQAIAVIPADDWDVPTAASPVVGRSVFPLAPPTQPPPYMPPVSARQLPPPLDSAMTGVTELLAAHPVGLPDPVNEGLESSDIDVIFGESKFVNYDTPVDSGYPTPTTAMPPTLVQPPEYAREQVWPAVAAQSGFQSAYTPLPFGTPSPVSTVALYEGPRRAAPNVMPRSQKILIGAAGGLVAVLALVALFLLGMRIGGGSAVTEAVATPAPEPIATQSAPAVGPLADGDHAWDELLGGECLTAYESPWQDTYTVIDCAEPHTGQLLSKSTLPDDSAATYPSETELQSRITLECSATTVLDYAAAEAYDDIQLDSSFPATPKAWAAGERNTYCFVTRAGGGDLEGSLAVPTA